MSSKLTPLTQSFSYAPPPSVLYGSGAYSLLGSLCSMHFSGCFDPIEAYDGYKAVEFLDPACTGCLTRVKRIRRIYNSPTNPDGDGSYQLDGEYVEAVDQTIGQIQNSSLSHPPSGTFQSQIIPSNSTNFQPRLASVPSSIHQSSPHPSTARPPALASAMRPSPFPQYRPSPIPPFSNLQSVASMSNQSRAERLPLP
ncbi:hypothetical protein O181_026895 [Austropuccinia psidii MF-1]|uniref:Uncharacterized protein n=1 Tax=Austropuccinia psidii MF-1 TaxID=1389203 RepID=A0A9Q3H2M8_9BASI|nr:hypothetical protein [Austropuccinia psidii MF-1]